MKIVNYISLSTINFVIANKIGYYNRNSNKIQKNNTHDSTLIALFTPITMPYLLFTTSSYCFAKKMKQKQ